MDRSWAKFLFSTPWIFETCSTPFIGVSMEKEKMPVLHLVQGSEIAAEIDLSATGIDGVYRPIIISIDIGGKMTGIDITLQDSKRLIVFLENTIKFFEDKLQ